MHRLITGLLAGAALLPGSAAVAADALKFGPPPAWVHPQALPVPKASDAPVQMLLNDQQIAFEPGTVTTFTEGALKIVNSQGLAAGNLALVWQPATDTVTVNKLQIRRGDKIIDVLASGQTFTVLRRETNLDAATLDGTLTATIQPEGLQEGDILDLATTVERRDPVLKGHVEAMFGGWDGLPIQAAHAILRWPASLPLDFRETPNLPGAQRSSKDGVNQIELSARDVDPLVPPNGAPARFKIGRLAEATDFKSWSDLADLFIPLFRDASAIPASGPLHVEVEKIRASTSDPAKRAEQALALVQDRVRYVALLMGQGGYVPATAETTWSRRFGDCKAKTALLLGILHSLGIEAEPVIVQASLGDMIADRAPIVGLFNHVLVRAHVGGKDYWLDGTRSGDSDLDAIAVPDFGWGLPLVAHAQLVRMVPRPLDLPNVEHAVTVDASAGVYAPAPVTIDETYRGDSAVQLNVLYSAATAAQRDEALHDKAKGYFDDFTVASSSFKFDKARRELDITISGTAKLNWKDGWTYVPTSSIGFDPDFDRAAGPLHDVPLAVDYPRFVKDRATFRLPAGFAAQQKLSAPVHETLAGVEYARTEALSGDVLTVDSSERSLVPEVPYTQALAAASRLRALDKEDVYLSAAQYRAGQKDLSALAATTPASADDYVRRGNQFLDAGKLDPAIADFTAALEQDPKNAWALASRGVAHAWKRQFEEAEKDISAATALDPNNAAALRGRGLVAELKSDWKGAIDWFTQSLRSEPGNIFALGHRASAELALGMNAQALADIDLALASNPDAANLHVFRARILAMQGKKDAALAEIALIAKQPQDQGISAAIGLVYQMLGLQDQANGQFKQAIGESGEDAQSLARKAVIEYQTGDQKAALADSQKALVLDPTLQELRVLRANILFKQGDKAAVAAEAKAITKDNPDSGWAFVGAGKIYAKLGMTAEAFKAFDRAIAVEPQAYVYINRSQIRPGTDIQGRLADLDQALKLEPDNFDALSLKATVLVDAGRYGEALDLYDRIPKNAGNELAIGMERAKILSKASRSDDAQKLFTELRLKSHTPGDLNNLCYSEATAGILLDAALEECTEALKLSPGNSGFEDSLGMVLLKLGRIDESIAAYSRALAKTPLADSYMGRAFAYARKGNSAAAQRDRAEAVKRSPSIESVFEGYGLKFDEQMPGKPAATTKPTIVSITPR